MTSTPLTSSGAKAKRLPEPFHSARAIARELRTLAVVGPTLIKYALTSSRDVYKRELPVQAALKLEVVPGSALGDLEQLRAWLGVPATDLREGEDSIYLAPEAWLNSALAPIAAGYPQGCGLKIAKNPGGVEAYYLTPRDGRHAQQQFSGSHADQLLTYAFLHMEGLAPRLYDMIELVDAAGNARTAYVLRHVKTGPLSKVDFNGAVEHLKALCDKSLLHLVAGGGWNSIDFQLPDGHGNVIYSEDDQRPYYVDVHNFSLGRYDQYLEGVARRASAASHFGNTSVLLGGANGSYLYQEVPGVPLPAKRSPATRMKTYDRLMEQAGVSVAGKAVYDIGCNLGLMGAEHLRRGATWLHGWDMPQVVPQSEQVLLSIGCTRFSLTPQLLSPEVDLFPTLPDFLQRKPRDQVVLNYLAVREHMGWLPTLKTLNWKYMLYEGHQGDAPLDSYVADLQKMMPVKVLSRGDVSDANSKRRDAAIIERLD